MGPDYKTPAVEIPIQFKEGVDWQRANANPQASLSNTWWLDYHDETLTRLIDEAQKANQSIAKAEATYRLAQAAVMASEASFFPTIDAQMSGCGPERGWVRQTEVARRSIPSGQACRTSFQRIFQPVGSLTCGAAFAGKSSRAKRAPKQRWHRRRWIWTRPSSVPG